MSNATRLAVLVKVGGDPKIQLDKALDQLKKKIKTTELFREVLNSQHFRSKREKLQQKRDRINRIRKYDLRKAQQNS